MQTHMLTDMHTHTQTHAHTPTGTDGWMDMHAQVQDGWMDMLELIFSCYLLNPCNGSIYDKSNLLIPHILYMNCDAGWTCGPHGAKIFYFKP